VARRARPPVVTLTTDFGLAGHHAGVLRGVILAACPGAQVADLTHGIPAGDVEAAAWALRWSWRHFPAGTVHCVVVDPGVGSPRRALAARAGGHAFVGPDNGVLSLALGDAGRLAGAVAIAPPPSPRISWTFHGRDLFAPAAARLAAGTPLARLGRRVTDWARLPHRPVRRDGPGALEGEIVAVDRWGNLAANITEEDLRTAGLGDGVEVRVGRRTILGLRRYYAEARPGEPVVLLNSDGHLEIAVNLGRADALLGARRGTAVRVSARPR